MRCMYTVFFFNRKTAYEMRISDWSSDVCSSDLFVESRQPDTDQTIQRRCRVGVALIDHTFAQCKRHIRELIDRCRCMWRCQAAREDAEIPRLALEHDRARPAFGLAGGGPGLFRKAADVRCRHRNCQILVEGALRGPGPVRR